MPKINPDAASIGKATATLAKGTLEESRAAKRNLWFAVRHAGRHCLPKLHCPHLFYT